MDDKEYQKYVQVKTIARLKSYIKDIEDGKIEVLDGAALRPDSLGERSTYEMYFRFKDVPEQDKETAAYMVVQNRDRCLRREMVATARERIQKISKALEENEDKLVYFAYGKSDDNKIGYLDVTILDADE